MPRWNLSRSSSYRSELPEFTYSGDSGARTTRDTVKGVAADQQARAETHLKAAVASFERGELTITQLQHVAQLAAVMGVRLER